MNVSVESRIRQHAKLGPARTRHKKQKLAISGKTVLLENSTKISPEAVNGPSGWKKIRQFAVGAIALAVVRRPDCLIGDDMSSHAAMSVHQILSRIRQLDMRRDSGRRADVESTGIIQYMMLGPRLNT